MTDEVVLEVRNLTKRFSGLVAVNNLNLKVRKGKIHALIGPNGAGKTTTVNMITGVIPQTEGEIYFQNNNISKLEPYKRAQLGIGRTFQNLKLFSSMTVLENLMVGAQWKTNQNILKYLVNYRNANREEKILQDKACDVLDFIEMYFLKDEIVGNLPYGYQKMCELGRTLMVDPKLILLDEPAAGLNPSERKEFIDIIQKVFDKGVDLFLIEHNMDVIMNLSHDITVLNFGSVIASGNPKEIQENEDVIIAYLGEGYRKSVVAKGGIT